MFKHFWLLPLRFIGFHRNVHRLAGSPVVGSVVTAIFKSCFWFTVVLKCFLCLWLFHKVAVTQRQQIIMKLLKLWITTCKGENAMLKTRIKSWIQFIWQFKEKFGTNNNPFGNTLPDRNKSAFLDSVSIHKTECLDKSAGILLLYLWPGQG